MTAKEMLYLEHSQKKKSWLYKRARRDDRELHVSNHRKAQNAALAGWGKKLVSVPILKPLVRSSVKPNKKLQPGDASERRRCIAFIFRFILESPKEADWKELGTVSDIMARLSISPNSTSSVVNQLKEMLDQGEKIMTSTVVPLRVDEPQS